MLFPRCNKFIEQYQVIDSSPDLALDIGLVKIHLKMDPADTSEDDYLTLLIQTVTTYFEKYTGKTLITKTYQTYLDRFYYNFEIRKAPNMVLTAYEYLVSGVWTAVPTANYYTSNKIIFNSINLAFGQTYPANADIIELPIRITFTAGYGPDDSAIPSDIKEAMMMHVANLYYNRGDCSEGACFSCMGSMTMLIYDLNKIKNVIGY